MISTPEKKRLLGQLASAFWHTGHDKLAKNIEALEEAPLEAVVRTLTTIERTPGLKTDLWTLVVQAKGVIAGKVELDNFIVESLKYQGLM